VEGVNYDLVQTIVLLLFAVIGWFAKDKLRAVEESQREQAKEIKQLHADHTDAKVSAAESRAEHLAMRNEMTQGLRGIKEEMRARFDSVKSDIAELKDMQKDGRH